MPDCPPPVRSGLPGGGQVGEQPVQAITVLAPALKGVEDEPVLVAQPQDPAAMGDRLRKAGVTVVLALPVGQLPPGGIRPAALAAAGPGQPEEPAHLVHLAEPVDGHRVVVRRVGQPLSQGGRHCSCTSRRRGRCSDHATRGPRAAGRPGRAGAGRWRHA